MKEKTYFLITLVLFLVVGALHLLRLLGQWEMRVGDYQVPMALSWIAVILLGYLAYSAYNLETKK